MFGLRFGAVTAGKVGYLASCLAAAVVLVISGYAHKVVSLVSATGGGASISDSPSVGAMNILVMGLESRTNYQGEELDPHLIHVMHTGTNGGAQDTNTLILIHIFAGGQQAVGFSIPRDDLVNYPHASYLGIDRGKIDQAYDYAYNESLQQTSGTSESHDQRYLQANQAGQLFEVQTVEQLTGVRIDHFIEVNLFGFYFLAAAFGGIEACVKPAPASILGPGLTTGANLTDYDPAAGVNRSGFDAYKDGYSKAKGGAQYLHLDAAQSLAFVRSRHTLPGVDIGRTYRQQAAIDYVIWKLKNEGALSGLGTADNLLATASRTLITDAHFNLLDFATNMRALTGSHMHFQTLPSTPSNGPVVLPGFPQGEFVNYVNVPDIQRIVRNAFYPRPGADKPAGRGTGSAKKTATVPAPATITVDVYNGNPSAQGLAGKTSAALVALGYKAGAVQNASAQTQAVQPGTQVFYGAGARANATAIATRFGATAKPLAALPPRHVEILIGSTVTTVPAALTLPSTASASTQSVAARVMGSAGTAVVSDQATAMSAGSGTGGGFSETLKVTPKTPFGTPCVY